MAAKEEKEPKQEQAKPWGRFKLVSKEPAEESEHIYFSNKVTTIGRNKRRCDLVISRPYISSVHCMVQLDGLDKSGDPVVKLLDNSRNGIYVNEEPVGKGASAQLGNGYTIHFTKPGTTPAGVIPLAYKLEFLKSPESSPVSPKSEEVTSPKSKGVAFPKSKEVVSPKSGDEEPEDVNMTVVADENFEATQLADPPSPSEKKRKRMDDEPAVVTVATQELESKFKEAQNQIVALTEDQQSLQVQVNKLQQENMNLMAKLEEATAKNLQLKTDLAAKDRNTEVKVKEAIKKRDESAASEILKVKEELTAKDRIVELKIKEAVKKSQEADRETRAQEMAAKLKEATKKYQQKVEAEHFEQRREMSEKMAAFANENEKLQTSLGTKEDELAECEDKLASLREKVTVLTSTLAEKEKALTEREEKIGELEEKISAIKDESSELMGLLAAAEDKVIVAENKAAEASIAAAAAAKASNGADANERHELQAAITSLRTELETYRSLLASREEELKKQQEATSAAATASPASVAAENIGQDDDAETLRARLAAALNLFGQVQALGLQGRSLITGTSRPELGDLHLLSAASAESERTSTAVPDSPSSSPSEENADDAKESPVKKSTEKKAAKKSAKDASSKVEQAAHAEDSAKQSAAEPKSSPTKLKREKKKSIKQAAPLSAAIEADAASAIAAMASAESSGKSSPSDASTAVANGDGDGDWEMLE
ncbi:SMAD/FHA domain [Phytophthora cinnamomi]|uniref:SMAD/FHA domain n=1 Tax=Phytophthora cinnamomi TaxID=4785 RepID=UPI00355A8914|nr:SMAD/FHA domain [Phytophthora cinnamomi]